MPHINFAPINTKFRNSTGCKMSVDYLSKENEGKELSSQEHFFNDKQDFIGKESAKKNNRFAIKRRDVAQRCKVF